MKELALIDGRVILTEDGKALASILANEVNGGEWIEFLDLKLEPHGMKGDAGILCLKLLKLFRARKVKALVKAGNDYARRLYKALGFVDEWIIVNREPTGLDA
jgi:hypothetical protein